MTTLLQLGTEWDVRAVLVIAGIVVIVFGIAGFLIIPKVGFQPLPPLRGAALIVFGVALLGLGLALEFSEEEQGPATSAPSARAPVETSTPVATTPAPTLPATSTPLSPTPTPCPLVSARPPIGEPLAGLTVTISDPGHCVQDVPPGQAVIVRGMYSGDLMGKEIWLLAYGPDKKYYPQSACDRQGSATASGGQWVRTVHFGQTEAREQFDLVVAIADVDGQASREFKMWLQRGCDTGHFPGFVELPGGLAEMAAITVQTRG